MNGATRDVTAWKDVQPQAKDMRLLSSWPLCSHRRIAPEVMASPASITLRRKRLVVNDWAVIPWCFLRLQFHNPSISTLNNT